MKILIIKLSALGDIVMSTPAIRALTEQHRQDELYLLTSPQFAGLFDDWDGLAVKDFPRHGTGAAVSCIIWLRAQRFDRIYDLQSSDRSRILCAASGAREIVGNHNLFPYTHHPGNRYTGQSHIFTRHKEVLASVNINITATQPCLPVPGHARLRVDTWLQQKGLGNEKILLMHAGASPRHPHKRWPYYGELAGLLEARGYRIVWLGTAAEAELNARLAQAHGINASNEFSVVELIALGQRARFAVTNDSGPMHVLACADIPVYAFFGPTNWRRYHAIGQKQHVISLQRTNALWREEDFDNTDTKQLARISAQMVFTLLLKENRISA